MSLHHHKNPNATTASSFSVVHIASLTNQELFTEVIAAIKRSLKQQKKNQKNWQSAAVRVASSASKGEHGYRSADEWVQKFNELSSDDDKDTSSDVGSSPSFGEALNALPLQECYRNRVTNALSALSSSTSLTHKDLPIRQIVGLVRGCALVDNDNVDASNNDHELQARALSCLLQAMPQISSNPHEIFSVVQLPILQKFTWNAFINSGINFSSPHMEATFRSLLSLDFDEMCTSSVSSGEKRKRTSEDTTESSNDVQSSTIAHLLEAAHLARKGAVRAQHGAVIYIPSDTNGETQTKVIGRGWNHDFLLDRSKSKKNKIVLHSEAHAVVDAMSNHGEDECFEKLFPRATIMIVELESDYAYETCHPCPKCDPLLRAVGITTVLHTTPFGRIEELDLSPANADLFSNENVSIPLSAACDEQKIKCKKLQQALMGMKL